MPLTHDFKETIRTRAQHDETGKAVLRDYVNATVGFQKLEERTRIPVKSLMTLKR